MKKHYYILFAALALLASCMGESGDVWIYGSQTGVIRGDAEKYIQLYSGDRVTSDALQTQGVENGDCCLVDYKLNYGLPDSIEEGYYRVDIQKYEVVPHCALQPKVDTVGARPDESFLTLNVKKCEYVDGILFIFPEYKRFYSSQQDGFSVSYDPAAEPEKDEATGLLCWHIYLRSTSTREQHDTVYRTSIKLPQALDISAVVEGARSKGYLAGDSLNLFISYPEYFMEDSASCGWRTSDAFTVLLNKRRKANRN